MNDITIIVPTCYRQSAPKTDVLDRTIASVRKALPESLIILTVDGPPSDLTQEQSLNYLGFKDALAGRYDNTRLVCFSNHGHQTGNFGFILSDIQTPLLFYCEDDWEINPHGHPIPWRELSDLILRGEFNQIKFHAHARIHPFHEHLMRERVIYQDGIMSDRNVDGRGVPVPIIRTIQFSSNPHLASVEWYRRMYDQHLRGQTHFIESILHGIFGQQPWEANKLGIYNPVDYEMYRCLHLDGKGAL